RVPIAAPQSPAHTQSPSANAPAYPLGPAPARSPRLPLGRPPARPPPAASDSPIAAQVLPPKPLLLPFSASSKAQAHNDLNSFRIRNYKKRACNSFRIHTYRIDLS